MKAWWAEFEDREGGRGLGLSGRDTGQQGAEERRQSRPHRALLACAQRPAVRGAVGSHQQAWSRRITGSGLRLQVLLGPAGEGRTVAGGEE